MKPFFTLLTVGILFLTSCKKDDDDKITTYPEENPLEKYLELSKFNEKTSNVINSSNYEFGYKFKPKLKGKINAITFKIPDYATNIRVTLWNANDKTIVRTITIPKADANIEVKQNIDPIALDPSQEYLLTYNGNDWYERKRGDGSNTTYPIDAGNISITGYRWQSGTAQTYPNTSALYYYAGDLSIVFQQTE